MNSSSTFPKYPRRQALRAVLRLLIKAAFALLTRMSIHGKENLPASGPLILVGNHFSFIDPVAMIHAVPWPIEFLAGFRMPNAPPVVTWLPKLWGVFPIHRGSVSRRGLRAAESILDQGGVLGIFPEAGNWAAVLRPARPGAAYLAARCGAPIVPIGLTGLPEVFPSLRRGRRAKVEIRIGTPIGPFQIEGSSRQRRQQIEDIGEQMMRAIAALIPDADRGCYADDPATRQAARGTEIYPWADQPDI